MKLINDHMAVKARVLPPTGDGFLMLAGEVGSWRGPFVSTPVQLAAHLKALAVGTEAREANVFRAVLRPPGEGDELLAARGIQPARYDIVVLIRTTSVEAALELRESAAYKELARTLRAAARRRPGAGAEWRAAGGTRPGRDAVAVLPRTPPGGAAVGLRERAANRKPARTPRAPARRTHQIVADNAGRLGDVDHSQDHRY